MRRREAAPNQGVVGLDDLRVIRVGLAEFDTGGGVVGPGRGVAVRALARVGGDVAAVGPEGGERGQVVGVVVAEESRLTRSRPTAPRPSGKCCAFVQALSEPSVALTRAHPIAPSPLRGKCCAFVQSPYKPSGALDRGAPFGDFAASQVVFVAGGFALGVGDDGGSIEVLVIDRGGSVAGGVGAADAAPGEVGVRGRGVAAAVRGGPGDARGGVGSGEGAANAAVIALRGDEAIHDPSGGREGGGGDGFAVQSGHGVIVSIGDVLRACQAAVFGFRDIGREPGSVLFLRLVHPKAL